ncbi:MAG: SDR family oxidoreductase [Deltaproteobacteria bacterium]|nr:SDR family oxidoreductase [Deltaproteobacteria bacterium]
MKVLIAGCGYVGEALGHELLALGDTVICLKRDTRGLGREISPWAADLTVPSSLMGLPADVTAVVFCAGARERSEAAYTSTYVRGLENLLSALGSAGAELERLIFTSSTAVYEHEDGRWVDEDSPAEPTARTARCLLEAEAITLRGAPRASVVRLGGIYGPGRAGLVERIRSGQVTAPGATLYTNRVHQDDCAGVLAHLLHAESPPPLLLAVDDCPVDLSELYRWLADQLGVAAPRASDSAPRGRFRTSKRCRNARLKAMGYRLRMPSFREGYAALLQEAEA